MARPQLVVIAAGMGSRYGGLKQMDPVGPGGEILLDYAVYDAIKAGFDEVVFVLRSDIADDFRRRVGDAIAAHTKVSYAIQRMDDLPEGFEVPEGRTKPWGTAHAVMAARKAVDRPFAVINADDYYGRSAFEKIARYLSSAADAGGIYDYCMVGYVLRNTLTEHGHVARGVCGVSYEGLLTSVVERTRIQPFEGVVKFTEDGENWTEIDAETIVSMNMWGFTPSYIVELERRFPAFLEENIDKPKAEYFVPAVVDQLVAEGKATVRVLPTDEKWFGVTYKPDMALARQAVREKIAAGLYGEKLWS
jgi:dTDP-glucose pyrophosphorylase